MSKQKLIFSFLAFFYTFFSFSSLGFVPFTQMAVWMQSGAL